MKRFQNILMAVAVAALAVVSCAKEEVAPESNISEDKVYEYFFTLGEGDTKATLEEGNVVTWSSNDDDYLGVLCKYTDESYSYAQDNTKSQIKHAENNQPAQFNIKSYKALTKDTEIYCYFPFEDGSKFETSAAVKLYIPTQQNNSINDMPMASKPFIVPQDIEGSTTTAVGDIYMLMLGSIARYKIFSSNTDYQGETIKSVSFSTESTTIAGKFGIDIGKINTSDPSTLEFEISENKSNSIEESVADKTVTGDKEDGIVDMVIAPGTYSGTLTIATSAASYEFTLTDKEFQRAHIKPFSVDLASVNCKRTEFETAVYELVTDINNIISGEYLIAAEYNSKTYFVPNAKASASNVLAKECSTLSKVGNNYSGDATGFNWTFTGTNTAMSIISVADNTCYLYATNTNNGMVVGTTADTWGFTAVTGGFNMKDVSKSRYLALYNDSNWRCYTNTNNGNPVIKLYKLHDTTPSITGTDIEMESAESDVAESELTFHNFESAPAATDFTVVSKPDYVSECEFSDITKDGASFACIVSGNYSIENDREGEIEISANGVSTTISISQPKSVFVVTAETNPLIIENTAESTCSFNIKSTFAGTLEIDDAENFDCPTSYTADATEGVTITIKAKNGGADEPRDAKVTVHREGCDDVDVNIQQNKAGATELSVPENIAISSPSPEGFSASWDEVTSASSYHWILSTQSTSEAAAADASAITSDATTNSIDYEGTIAAGTYYFYVKAVGNGTSYSDSEYSTGKEVVITSIKSVTFKAEDFDSNNYSIGKTKDGITAIFAKGEGSNFACYNPIRFYAKNTLTLSSTNAIKKVEFEFETPQNLSASVGTYNSQTKAWEGSATSVQFTNTATSQAKIKGFIVYYEFDPDAPSITGITIKTPPTKIEYSEGDKFDPTGLVITASYDKGGVPKDISYDGNESAFTFSPDLNTDLKISDEIVTITYADKSTTQEISVSESATKSVTYKQSSTSAASVSSGTAPTGSSVTFSNTYTNNKEQLTKGNTMTYTLKGYAGKTITGITLSMKSNSSGGTGTFSMKAGTTTLAEIESAQFKDKSWYGSWSTTYVDVTPSMLNNAYVIMQGEDVVVTISASVNSLYCQSITITYK